MFRTRVHRLAAMAAALLLASPVCAQETFVFDNVRSRSPDGKAEFAAPRVEVQGAGVPRAELERLASPDTPQTERLDLLMKLTARRVFIPEITLTNLEDGKSRIVARGAVAENVDRGRFDRLALEGFDGVIAGEGEGEGRLKSGPLVLEGGDFTKLIAAARAGAPENGTIKLRQISWSGFEASFPDPALPTTAVGGNLYRLAVGSVRAVTDFAGDVPTKGTAHFEGLVFAAPPASEAGRALAGFGYERVEIGMGLDAIYDAAAKSLEVREYSLNGANAGSVALSGSFGGLGPDAFLGDADKRLNAVMGGNVGALALRYVDAGLFEKALAFYAASNGKTTAAVRRDMTMMLGALPILMGGDPASLRLAQAFGAFILEPKSLTLTLKPRKGPLGFLDLVRIAQPGDFFSRVEVTATANR